MNGTVVLQVKPPFMMPVFHITMPDQILDSLSLANCQPHSIHLRDQNGLLGS